MQAATHHVKVHGFETLTIRSLATDLGVAPMTLYRHVRDKDDLLDEVVARMLAGIWRPRVRRSDWRAWIAEAAERLRRFLVREPVALHIYLRRPVVSPAAMARMEAMVEVLMKAGFDAQSSATAYATVHTYTIGFAALQASRERYGPVDEQDPVVRKLASFTTRDQFAVGLGYLLDGFDRASGRFNGPGSGTRAT